MLADLWLQCGLTIATPRLTRRLASEDEIAAPAAQGIHPPGERPFRTPWTEGDPARFVLRGHGHALATWEPAVWRLGLGVSVDARDGEAVVSDRLRLPLSGWRGPRPAVQADALALPFRSSSFAAVAALWMLYHLPSPVDCLRAVARVLRPDGDFVTCAPSRFNDPELAAVLPRWGAPSTFDAENAVAQVDSVFDVVEVTRWDVPLITLPDEAALTAFCRGRGLPAGAAAAFTPPLTVTQRGVLIWARVTAAGRRGDHR